MDEVNEQKILAAALDRYGADAQTLMLFEEMSELQKELCKKARGRCNLDQIAEEIADVQIMLDQMILLHGCRDKVSQYRQFKLLRLATRLEEEDAEK